MNNRFFQSNKTQSSHVEILRMVYENYEREYFLLKNGKSSADAVEAAWLAIGKAQATLPESVLYRFCINGSAFSFATHGFMNVCPATSDTQLGKQFTLVKIKSQQDLYPFAREPKGKDFCDLLGSSVSHSAADVYVDPEHTKADCEALIRLCKDYFDHLMEADRSVKHAAH